MSKGKTARNSLLFLLASIVLVSAAVAFGLWITPSPSTQLEIELDKQRVNDLIALADAVLSYRRTNGRFPVALNSLPESASLRLADRQTGAAYGYNLDSLHEFRLCADFAMVSDIAVKSSPPEISGWKHQAGHQCFAFSVGLSATKGAAKIDPVAFKAVIFL